MPSPTALPPAPPLQPSAVDPELLLRGYAVRAVEVTAPCGGSAQAAASDPAAALEELRA